MMFPHFTSCITCVDVEELGFNLKEIFSLYFSKFPDDFQFIEDCTKDFDKHKTWVIIEILSEKEPYNNFCIEKSINYLEEVKLSNFNKDFVSNSLKVLFKNNHPKAIEYYLHFIENTDLDFHRFKVDNFANYNYINDFSIIINLFDKIYLDKSFDSIFNGSTNFLNQYVSNLSKDDAGYLQLKDLLIKKKNALKELNDDSGFFHINLLIDVSDNSYYVSKSKPLTFNEAKMKVEQIIN